MDAQARGVVERVQPLAEDAIRAEGAELVDLEFRREPAGWVLRLFIDREGGVTLADCQRVSEVVGTLLEIEDPIPHAYTLEVSSPGLTRPLTRAEDWRRAVGSLVKVVTREPIAGSQSLTGRLAAVGEASAILEIDGGDVEIPLDMVARARRELEWPAGAGRSRDRKHKGPAGSGGRRDEREDGK